MKKLARTNIPIEAKYIFLDLFLVFRHVSLKSGSVGHGSKEAFFIKKPPSNKIIPVTMEIVILYWDTIINCGKKLTIDAKVAPAPIRTNRAGKAQHISVDEEAKSVINPSLIVSLYLNMI